MGQPVAEGESMVLHAPLNAVVVSADESAVKLRVAMEESAPAACPVRVESREALPGFARDMGLAGMGGSMFPYAIKFRACMEIHTLVVNAVECEPGIEIDECLLLHEAEAVYAGLDRLRELLDVRHLVLAVKKSSHAYRSDRLPGDRMRILAMPGTYPAGAEKLIVCRLAGKMPPAGVLPMQWGYLVMSVASLWALGRRLTTGRPCIDRPLTLVSPDGLARNLVVPVGTPVRHILETCGVAYDDARHMLVAGGLMMGKRVTPEFGIQKGTNALFVQPVTPRLCNAEEPCILCGSCFDACPLHLHPISMADRIRERRYSRSLETHLDECFLCGACSAVCPADIPLVQYFHEGKQWLKEKQP